MCTKVELFQRKMQSKVYFGGLHEKTEYFKERYEINKKFLMLKNPLLSTINTVLKKSISVIVRRFFYYIKQII